MTYTIGEMAKRLGVAPSTLRYYDKEGLLPGVGRSDGGMRVFRDSAFEALKIIHCLKASGMQIREIREFIRLVSLGDQSIGARLALFRKRKAEVEKQMAALRETLDVVNFKCWYYETAEKAGTTAVPDSMTDDELPAKLREVRARLKNP